MSKAGKSCGASDFRLAEVRGCSAHIEPHSRVMAGLVPAIHAFIEATKDVDARDKRGHDGERVIQSNRDAL